MGTLLIYMAIAVVGASILSVVIWGVVPGSRERRLYAIASVLLVALLCSGVLWLATPVDT